MKLKDRILASDFFRLFNFSTDVHKGRTLLLIRTILSCVASPLTTGALYTAFLAENGIDIVRVGIISLIPYISWTLSIFSPMIMARFKKRQGILMISDVIYHGCVILATTIMPLFVEDPTAKTVWFAVFLLIGSTANALLGSGFTSWQLRFIPSGRELNAYVAYNNVISQIISFITAILASVAASILAESANQMSFLFWLRIGAFAMYMIGSALIYLCQQEQPMQIISKDISPLHLLTVPTRHKPFLLTALIVILWSIVGGINANTYTYYLLETVNAPMYLLYLGSFASMMAGLLLTRRFRRLVDNTSPYNMIFLFLILFALTEFPYIFIGENGLWLYCILVFASNIVGVGFSMGYGSLFYLHLPENSNKDLFSTFWNLSLNLSTLLGSVLGTWLLAIMEAHGTYLIFGNNVYPSQLLILVKVFLFLIAAMYVRRVTPYLMRAGK